MELNTCFLDYLIQFDSCFKFYRLTEELSRVLSRSLASNVRRFWVRSAVSLSNTKFQSLTTPEQLSFCTIELLEYRIQLELRRCGEVSAFFRGLMPSFC